MRHLEKQNFKNIFARMFFPDLSTSLLSNKS